MTIKNKKIAYTLSIALLLGTGLSVYAAENPFDEVQIAEVQTADEEEIEPEVQYDDMVEIGDAAMDREVLLMIRENIGEDTKGSAAAAAVDEILAQKESERAAELADIVEIVDCSGEAVVDYARRFVGNPYKYGGTSLTEGTDCSGFVMRVYEHFGVQLEHSSRADRTAGRAVEGGLDMAQPGDLICYAGHVGIYAGNGMLVHASTEETGITISDATYARILAIRRIFE